MATSELGLVLLSALLHATWNVFAKRSVEPLAFFALLSIVWVGMSLPVIPFIPLSSLPTHYWMLVAASALICDR